MKGLWEANFANCAVNGADKNGSKRKMCGRLEFSFQRLHFWKGNHMRIPTMGLSECKSLFSSTEKLNFLFILFILQKQQQSPHAARHKASLSPVQERLTSSSLILPLIEPILPFFPSFHCSISSCLSSFKRPSWLSLRLFTSWCLHSFFLIVLAQAGISSSAP